MSSKGASCNSLSVRKHFVQCTKKSRVCFFVLHYVTSSITKVANGYVVNGNILMRKMYCVHFCTIQVLVLKKKLISNVINEADRGFFLRKTIIAKLFYFEQYVINTNSSLFANFQEHQPLVLFRGQLKTQIHLQQEYIGNRLFLQFEAD